MEEATDIKALVILHMEYCGAIWGPDMLASCRKYEPLFDNPLQAVSKTTLLRGMNQLRKSVSRSVLHNGMCVEPVARGWIRFSLAHGEGNRWHLIIASLAAVKESIRAQAGGEKCLMGS
jgi:hypothetical protein